MKKVKLFCKTTLVLATMLLLGGSNVWGDTNILVPNGDFSSGTNGSTSFPNWTVFTEGAKYQSTKAVEAWNTNFDFYQTLTGLENGLYKVTVKGFYRNGDGGATTDNQLAVLYADGGQEVSVPIAKINQYSLTSKPSTGNWKEFQVDGTKVRFFVPDNINAADYAIHTANLYDNTLYVWVSNGTLKIGAKKTTAVANDWCYLDDFTVTKLDADFASTQWGWQEEQLTSGSRYYIRNMKSGTYLNLTDQTVSSIADAAWFNFDGNKFQNKNNKYIYPNASSEFTNNTNTSGKVESKWNNKLYYIYYSGSWGAWEALAVKDDGWLQHVSSGNVKPASTWYFYSESQKIAYDTYNSAYSALSSYVSAQSLPTGYKPVVYAALAANSYADKNDATTKTNNLTSAKTVAEGVHSTYANALVTVADVKNILDNAAASDAKNVLQNAYNEYSAAIENAADQKAVEDADTALKDARATYYASAKKIPNFVANFTQEAANALLVEDAIENAFSLTDVDGETYTFIPEGVVKYDKATNTLTALAAGTTVLTIAQPATSTIEAGSADFSFIVSKHDLVFTKSESLQTAYLVNDAALSLAELWANNGTGGTTTYEITSFVAAEGEQTGATAPAIANNVLTLGEAGVLVLKASFTGSAKYKDGEDTHTITISRRTNGMLNVTGADINNTWNQSINLSDYISKENTDGELVVGTSSDSEVATYDAETKQFALGIKTGTASFSISVPQTYLYEAVAAKTFTITANQSFYAYAESVILNAGNSLSGFDNSSFLTGLSQTLNQSEAEGILSDLRTEAKTFMNNHVFSAANVSFLLDNNSFEFADHNYGWSNISGYSAKTGTSSPYGEYAMQITQGVMSSIDAGYIEQYVTLHKGHYRLSAFVKLSYVDGAKLSFGNKELTINRTTEGQVYSVEFDVLSDNENVKISFSHPSQYDTFGKEVLIDNLEITYWSLNDLSLVAMNNEDGTDYYYATFSNADYAVEFGNDVEVYTVSVDGDRMNLNPVSNNQVPANNGVLIKSQSNNILYKYISSAADLSNNMLQPGTGGMTEGDNCRFYRLAYYDYAAKTGLGFYYGSGCEDGEAFMCKAGMAYLAVPRTVAAPARFLLGRQDVSTEIENMIIDNTSTSSSLADGKKVMVNGVLYIIRDGKTYDSFGRMVK